MKREFKFRHADEVAGMFVICAVTLFVLGVVLAGRTQGWFEGKFTLNVEFSTSEGSFGLQEGAIVQVRNTVAGRVGKIDPTEGGQMTTTLILKEGFHPFVTEDSVAKVKKKFGVAGDSFIEIGRGTGAVIEDGALIQCVRDEELMETAQKMLAELEVSVLPVFEEVERIVTSVAAILASVETGQGIAGAVVTDSSLRDDLAGIVSHLEGIAADAEIAVGQAGGILSNQVTAIVGDVTAMTGQTRILLTNDVSRIAAGMHGIQDELERTLIESRRLISGIQKHWMFRKYIKEDSETVPLIPAALCLVGGPEVSEKFHEALMIARASDNQSAIAKNAYNLAVSRLAAGAVEDAVGLNTEARFAYRSAGEQDAATYLLESEISRLVHDFDKAVSLVNQALGLIHKDIETETEAQILLATIQLDAENPAAASDATSRAQRLNRKLDLPHYAAAISGLRARIELRNDNKEEAAEAFCKQAEQLREAGALEGMALALNRAAEIYDELGMAASAAEYFYRAASSWLAQNQQDGRATEALVAALSAAESAGDTLLVKRIKQLQKSEQP
jgi:tetratricopeptide (TPR) repeat protein